MRVQSTRDDGERRRTFSIFNTTYDLTDKPVTFLFAAMATLAVFLSVVYVLLKTVLFIAETITTFVPNALSLILTALGLWLAAGLIKYHLTGSAKPFFTLDISLNTESRSGE